MTKDQDIASIPLERFKPLKLVLNTPKGRGVFTSSSIPAGTIIDVSPVLVLSPQENKAHIEHTSLYHYTYNWPSANPSGDTITTQAIVFGLGSLFNHSRSEQNIGWKRDVISQVIVYRALRDIKQGEELCISYGDKLTFQDADGDTNDYTEEEPQDILGRIALDED